MAVLIQICLMHGWLNILSSRLFLAVLLLDGHKTHYQPDVLQFAREHKIVTLSSPPHTTHESQLLDCLVPSKPNGLKFLTVSSRQTQEKLPPSQSLVEASLMFLVTPKPGSCAVSLCNEDSSKYCSVSDRGVSAGEEDGKLPGSGIGRLGKLVMQYL